MASNESKRAIIAARALSRAVSVPKSSVSENASSVSAPASSVSGNTSSVSVLASRIAWNISRLPKRLQSVRWMSIWMFFALIVSCHAREEQRFAMEPQDQSAIVGSRVTLPCRVENKAGALQWTKDDFGLGTHRNLSGYERYHMIGSDEEGDYSLDIQNISLEDDGKYQCQVSSGLNGEPAIRSRYAQLTVLVAPDPPRIIQGAFIDATEDQPVDIECVSVGGKPAAEITWVDGNQAVIKKHVENQVELMPDGQRYQTRSVLRLTPKKSHHNQTITCQAQNTADRAFRMATVDIEVKYAPKVNLRIKSGLQNEKIKEGTEARFICEVDANPLPQMYRWYINDSPVIGDYFEEMIIFNVTRKHNKAVVKCEVSNTVGKRDQTVTLDVTYPPTFRSRPQNIEAEEGARVTLSCDVDGQPAPEIRWLFHEPGRIGQVRGRAPNLKIDQVSWDTAGRYICKASVEGYPEIESEATVFIKGPPRILSNRTQQGLEGERVTIECAALCVPKPDDVRWYFEGKEISIIQNPEYAPLEEILPDGVVKSSLVIKASQARHYGTYNCSVTNEYGNANAAIILKPIKTLPLITILIGVITGVIIFSAFVILLVVCHRRRRQTGQKMSEKPDVTVTTTDIYKESDRSSNISDLKPQLHQSDGSYELDYTSSDRSDTKMAAGIPLSGPVPLPKLHDDPLMPFRYSNDYSDPTYSDPYFKNPAAFVYDYPQGYIPPPNLRVQSPTQLEVPQNRSLQGSLTRSIDTASTLPLSAGNNSQSNSLQRAKTDETDAINNLGLPVDGDALPIYAQPGAKVHGGVDLRYAATYGNPYLRNSSLGYGSQVHTAKPAATPAPPPYSSVRSSVVMPTGNGSQPSQATHV
ncbi:irregular chiasm C-roughest protein-like isoform X1 [Ostrinia nubilalis]|uniref:irregular chiasm C-roughest protein-like isoform X1 n=1 Tax=Ostrinia nubilalis TaxID=29057 RepID=UPI0030825F03